MAKTNPRISVDAIIQSLPPVGKKESITLYLKRMGWSKDEFATVCVEARSVLIRRGFGMASWMPRDGDNILTIGNASYAHVRRMHN